MNRLVLRRIYWVFLKKLLKIKLLIHGGEEKKKFKKKLKTEAISVMSRTHSITSVLPLG